MVGAGAPKGKSNISRKAAKKSMNWPLSRRTATAVWPRNHADGRGKLQRVALRANGKHQKAIGTQINAD